MVVEMWTRMFSTDYQHSLKTHLFITSTLFHEFLFLSTYQIFDFQYIVFLSTFPRGNFFELYTLLIVIFPQKSGCKSI